MVTEAWLRWKFLWIYRLACELLENGCF